MKAIIIAGVASGCGKTAISLGLMQAFARRGKSVQAFKSGPDFIDPGLHRLATGLSSHNLDGWMLDRDTVTSIFRRNHDGCDLSIIEGAMGLFDGIGANCEEGSTAQLAKILDVPVLLVLNARGLARSASAQVLGYSTFDPDLRLAGVLCNMVGSPVHTALLRESIEKIGINVLGGLPWCPELQLPSRRLGLVTADDLDRRQERLTALADWVEQALDLDALLDSLPDCVLPTQGDGADKIPEIRMGYARDRVFCFYYEENLRLLRQAGVDLVPFSPLEDRNLPPALHGLYLGGGYPDLYAQELAANKSMRSKIKEFCASGKPVYAECGGFMYLQKSLTTHDGRTFPMAGVYDFECTMETRRQALGYREIELIADSPLGQSGLQGRGHEFHYARLSGSDLAAIPTWRVRDRAGRTQESGYLKGNCLASFVHLHFASNPDLATQFVRACTL